MKISAAFAASAVLAVISIDSAMGMASYLKQLPNGDSFDKALGHKGDAYTDFGKAFSKVGGKWSADFCKQTFPGTSMTNGAAFGDPCCTWTAGGKADFTVKAFTEKPTQETKCASAAAPSSVPAAPSPANNDKPSQDDKPATTPAPAGDKPSQSSGEAPAPAPVPATGASTPTVRPSKCGVKQETRSNAVDDENDSDDETI